MFSRYYEERKIIKIENDVDLLQEVKERFLLDGEVVLQKQNDFCVEYVDVSNPEIFRVDQRSFDWQSPTIRFVYFVVPCVTFFSRNPLLREKKTAFYILIYLHVFLALPSKYRAQYLQNPLAFKYICSTATSRIMLQSDDNSIYGIYETQVTGHRSQVITEGIPNICKI